MSYTYTQPVREGQRYNLYHGTVEAVPVSATTSKLVYTLVFDNSMLADDAARDKDIQQRTARERRFGPVYVWPTIRKRQSHVGRPNQRRTYRSSASESRCLSAMTSTLQHPQIHTPRPHCVAILVCHHAG